VILVTVATPFNLDVHPKGQSAGLQEVFSSIQGEGPWVGVRQLFVRFNVCHLACTYCDTPQHPPSVDCVFHDTDGGPPRLVLPNPLPLETLLSQTRYYLNTAPHHSLSLTGGEPLLYTPFLERYLPQIAPEIPIYLETSGTQPEALKAVWPWVTYTAMDIKLPSATGEPFLADEQRAFYQMCKQKAHFIKLVVSQTTTTEELAETVFTVVGPEQPCIVIQPVSDLQTGQVTVPAAQLMHLQQFLLARYDDVRVIPQTHKYLGIV
jgi:7-carboxy-7-deazaguanine synthase